MFINNTNDSLHYGLAYVGLFVSFRVMKDTLKIGSTTDGYLFLPYAPSGFLLPGDTIWIQDSWLSNEYHDKLPGGNYSAYADLHFSFRDHVWSGPEKIEFFVLKF